MILGVARRHVSNTSIDDIIEPGSYFIQTCTSSTIPNRTLYGLLVVSKALHSTYGYRVKQTLYSDDATADCLARWGGRANDGTVTWAHSWTRLDNFGCDTPESLASLLGERFFIGKGSSMPLSDYPLGVFGLYDTNQSDSPEKTSLSGILIKTKINTGSIASVLFIVESSSQGYGKTKTIVPALLWCIYERL